MVGVQCELSAASSDESVLLQRSMCFRRYIFFGCIFIMMVILRLLILQVINNRSPNPSFSFLSYCKEPVEGIRSVKGQKVAEAKGQVLKKK